MQGLVQLWKGSPSRWIQLPGDHQTPSVGNGTHIAFGANTKKAVASFHAAALSFGGANNGIPGPRPDYGPKYFGAFALDPDGNRLEAVLVPPNSKKKTRPAGKPKKRLAKKTALKKTPKTMARKPSKVARKTPRKKSSRRGVGKK